jgi:hypothetical protein
VVGGSNPSGRACLSSTCDAEISIPCAIQSVIAIGPHESFAPELPEFPTRRLGILMSYWLTVSYDAGYYHPALVIVMVTVTLWVWWQLLMAVINRIDCGLRR